MSQRTRGSIIIGVFVVLLVAGLLHLRASAGSGPVAAAPETAGVRDARTACQGWYQVQPIITDAVQSNDPNVLYRLESGGGPHQIYISLMTWASLAYARQQSIVLASDLTNLKDEICSGAAGAEALSDLPLPATTIDGQCQSPTPNGDNGGNS